MGLVVVFLFCLFLGAVVFVGLVLSIRIYVLFIAASLLWLLFGYVSRSYRLAGVLFCLSLVGSYFVAPFLEDFAIPSNEPLDVIANASCAVDEDGLLVFSILTSDRRALFERISVLSKMYYGSAQRNVVELSHLNVFNSDWARIVYILDFLKSDCDFKIVCFHEADAIFDKKAFAAKMQNKEVLFVQVL